MSLGLHEGTVRASLSANVESKLIEHPIGVRRFTTFKSLGLRAGAKVEWA